MSKVSINEITLTNIGAAIRERTGKTDLIAPGDMPAEIRGIVGGSDPVIQRLEITTNGTYNVYDGVDGFGPVVVNVPQDGGPPSSFFNLTGRIDYLFYNGKWDWVLEMYGNQFTTSKISRMNETFRVCKKNIPFDINCESRYNEFEMSNAFLSYGGTTLPRVYSIYAPTTLSTAFSLMDNVQYFPEGFAEDWDWSYIESSTSTTYGNTFGLFSGSRKLRKVPQVLITKNNPNCSSNIYSGGFDRCNCLEEIKDLFVYYNLNPYSNMFSNTVRECDRLKDFTFKMNDGAPFVASKWKSQTIDLTTVGFGTYAGRYISNDTKVDGNIDLYLGYVENGTNPDGWATDVSWSVYNRKSAVRTINTLPDVSASGGVNTIKFKSAAASAVGEEYAMANLTEEEIAVAAAKGWTVTLV